MKKDPDLLAPFWDDAADKIWQTLSSGLDCAFINEGDPLLYGTFNYILRIFRERYPQVKIKVIPGVSSINAAFASAMLPMVSTKERLTVLSTTYENDLASLRRIIENFDTVVLLKINSMFDAVLGLLDEMGLTDNSVYIRRCTSHDEEFITDIRSLKGKKLDYMSLLVIRSNKGGKVYFIGAGPETPDR
jgi:precorrin-2/cobalt-factor-2 C20-methyltransferase